VLEPRFPADGVVGKQLGNPRERRHRLRRPWTCRPDRIALRRGRPDAPQGNHGQAGHDQRRNAELHRMSA